MNQTPNPAPLQPETGAPALGRRQFLSYTGLAVAAGALLLSGCKDDDAETPPSTALPPAGDTLLFTGTNTGLLNYLYVLEQVQAEFYLQLTDGFASGFSTQERDHFADIRDHELAHRELLKAMLGSDALPEVLTDFTTVNFSDRSSVLATASILKNLSVAAYNGAGELADAAAVLLLTAKIGSVEARHAAYIRSRIQGNSFSTTDSVNTHGLARSRKPKETLALADTYIRNPINTADMPAVW